MDRDALIITCSSLNLGTTMEVSGYDFEPLLTACPYTFHILVAGISHSGCGV